MTKTKTSFTTSRGDTFKRGEWIVAEHDIHQVGEIRDYDTHTSVDRSTGYILCDGRADDCWKLTLATKVIAEGVKRYRDKLGKLPGESAFNWPDIHCKLVEFAEIGYALDREMPRKEDDYDDAEKRHAAFRKQLWDPLEAWYEEVRELAEGMNKRIVGGVRIVGR